MMLTGFRVDLELLGRWLQNGRARKAALVADLQRRYGLPEIRKDGKACDSPLGTEAGRDAVAKAFADLGVPALPQTSAGETAIGREAMDRLAADYADNRRWSGSPPRSEN
ncbi:MAG: hypothetical protein ACXV5Q_09435 [Frankiaceae bacterium]